MGPMSTPAPVMDIEQRLAAIEQKLAVLESTIGVGASPSDDLGLDLDLESTGLEKNRPVQPLGGAGLTFGDNNAPKTPFKKVMPPPPKMRKEGKNASTGRK